MKLPGWLKDIRVRGILAGVFVLLILVLYGVHIASKNSSPQAPKFTLTLPSSLVLHSQATTTPSQKTSFTATSSASSSVASATPISKAPISPAPAPTQLASSANSETNSSQNLSSAGASLLKALVNIVCISADPSIPSISGSGVIIDPRGIIITAAHVAQLFLLQDYLGTDKVECIVRTGSPARRAYLAEPIYVSPTWIGDNPQTLTQTAPMGTGENDFAILGITATATSSPLASSFPYIPLAEDTLQTGDPVAIGSYGAQYLTAEQINEDLYAILVFGTIQDRYTFGSSNTVDLVSILGSAAAQEGSSGGGIVNSEGQLSAVITTSTTNGALSNRSLNAITIQHIRRSYTADTGNDLDTALQSNSVPGLVASFANESKLLGQKLLADIAANS